MGKGRFAAGVLAGAAIGTVAVVRIAKRLQLAGRGMPARTMEKEFSQPGANGTGHPVSGSNGGAVEFPEKELLRQCVHCGLCLPTCPTYKVLGLETDSPRGRIYQMRMVAEGKIDPGDPHFRKHMFQCLDCRACETACPSGVQYGRLLEAARSIIPPESRAEVVARKLLLGGLVNSRRMLAAAGLGARLYQRSGVQRVVRSMGLLGVVRMMKRMESMLPDLEGSLVTAKLPARTPAQGARRYTVTMLSGCVASEFFPETNKNTIAVLAANGCDVLVPPDQGCCGALQGHTGDKATAADMARHNIDVFERDNPDFIVVNAAGCGSTMKEYGELLHDDPVYAERAKVFSSKVRDIMELLAELPLRPPDRPVRRRVTYQDACHLAHGQKVRRQPRDILKAIPGLELVEMKESDWCCGSAGTYNVTQPELSEMILARKMKNVAATGAHTVVASNPGCLIQIAHGLRDRGIPMRIGHPVDLLAEAYSVAGQGSDV